MAIGICTFASVIGCAHAVFVHGPKLFYTHSKWGTDTTTISKDNKIPQEQLGHVSNG